MDILSFFRLLLPDEGIKFLAEWVPLEGHKRGGIFKHYGFTDLEDMASKALSLSASQKNIYYACAGYKEAITKVTPKGFEYIAGRTQDNAFQARALWLDIDVGKANDLNSYATQKEASEAIKNLCEKTGLHRPMVVSSGNGFHCYWLFDKEVPKDEWNALATTFRAVNKQCGTKVDPSRDKDIASVLRPPQTINHKGGKEVKVVRHTEAKPVSYYRAVFSEFLGIPNTPVTSRPKLGNQLAVEVTYPPSSLERITKHCATIKWFKDTGASDFEPTWRACLGIAKHTYDGEELAHKWSAQDARYEYNETQAKMDSWAAGPSLCETFKGTCESCKGCTQTVKTPIQLGYVAVELTKASEEEFTQVSLVKDSTGVQSILPTTPDHWPSGVTFSHGRMNITLPDKDGVPTLTPFAFPKFWPIARIRLEDGTYAMRMIMEVKAGKMREFDLPTKCVVDARTLKVALAANEIIVINERGALMYLQSYADKLRMHMDEVNTFDQFGWTADRKGILLGDQLLTTNGFTQVRLSEKLQKNADLVAMYQVKGTKEEWIEGVDFLYNSLPHSEPYQYAIATQFGAWLCPLMEADEWNGIPLSMTSGDSGMSKTTSIKIGLNAITRASVTTVSGSTIRGIPARISSMGSVPFLFDEITSYVTTGADMSDVAYTLSNGRARVGLNSDGTERKSLPPFKLMANMTSNLSSFYQLTESKANPEAAQMRIFEIALTDYPVMDSLTKNFADKPAHILMANKLVNSVYGVMTTEYLTYLIDNKDAITRQLDSVYEKLVAKVGSTGGNSTKERFYIRHVACAMVGLAIIIKLGYVTFDDKKLLLWALKHVRRMRNKARELASTSGERLSSLMSDFTGTLIITKEYDSLDVRTGPTEEPIYYLRGAVQGRVVLGSKKERGRVFLSVRAINDWCKKQSISPLDFRRELADEGYIQEGGSKPMLLAKGVPTQPLGQQQCIELDFSKMQGMVSEAQNVAEIVNKAV